MPSQALAATQLNGRKIDGKLPIVAKLSNPDQKQDRQGPMQEGRELFVRNLDFTVTEEEIKAAFSRFGTVESVRVPHNAGGRGKGIAFVVFTDEVSGSVPWTVMAAFENLILSQDSATKSLEMNSTKFKGRVINVFPSTNDTTKRQATTIINPATSRSSYSTTPDPGSINGHDAGHAGSPASQNAISQTEVAQHDNRKSRTIALMNVPDTFTSDRVRVLAETHGALVKLQLRPDHQGAMIEYVDTADAGKASLALDGYEVQPGRRLRVGTVAELFLEKAEVKRDKIGSTKKIAAPLQAAMSIRRPGQPGGRRGGKGGLGFKRGGVGHGGKEPAPDGQGEGRPTEAVKSNADFKAKFLKG